jgi:hypothetical protein
MAGKSNNETEVLPRKPGIRTGASETKRIRNEPVAVDSASVIRLQKCRPVNVSQKETDKSTYRSPLLTTAAITQVLASPGTNVVYIWL